MVMFGFLIALPGGRKKTKSGWRGGRAEEPGVLCSIHSSLLAMGRGPVNPMHLRPLPCCLGGTEKGQELQSFSFLAPFSCRDVQRPGGRSTLRGAQGAANTRGGEGGVSLKPVGCLAACHPLGRLPPAVLTLAGGVGMMPPPCQLCMAAAWSRAGSCCSDLIPLIESGLRCTFGV